MGGDLARKERFGLAIEVGRALYSALRVPTVVAILARPVVHSNCMLR